MDAHSNETEQKTIGENFPLALPQGTILAGQYTIDKVLGQGGFGITYMATDYKTKQKVAVKEFFPDSLAYRETNSVIPYTGERAENFEYGKENFLQEAKTLAEFIGCENIVRIFSYFEENGTAYFVMEYVEGISFDKYLKNKGGKISCDEAKNILVPIMEALAVVHSKGIVHRDVTPDNIYITDEGKVKLLDFGAARYSLGDKSKSLDVVLKHGFAPKEQYTRHGKQGPFTDIYSLGATFYFAITGRRPPDSIDRIEEDELIPPSNLGVDITSYQEEAILHALEVNPQARYQSMLDFRNVLLNEVPSAPQPAPATQQFFNAQQIPYTVQQPYPTTQQQPYPMTQQQPYPMAQQQPYPMTQQQPYPMTQQQPYPTTQQQPYPMTQQQPYPMTQQQPYPTTQQQPYPMAQQQPTENVSKQIGDAAKQLGSAAVKLGGGVAKQMGNTAKQLGKSAAKHMSNTAKKLSETAASVKNNIPEAPAVQTQSETAVSINNSTPEAPAAQTQSEAVVSVNDSTPEAPAAQAQSEAVQPEAAAVPKKKKNKKIFIAIIIVLVAVGVFFLTRGTSGVSGKAGTGSATLQWETFGNIQNGGIIGRPLNEHYYYYVTYDGHSVVQYGGDYEGSTLLEDMEKKYSNLICDENGMYYVADGKICYYDFDEKKGKTFSLLSKYNGDDLQLYISEDYYFVYVNGKLHRVTKDEGKEEQSIYVESPYKFALCGEYLFYIGKNSDNENAIVKTPAIDFSQTDNNTSFKNSDHYTDMITSDGVRIYDLVKSKTDPEYLAIERLDANTNQLIYYKIASNVQNLAGDGEYTISGFNSAGSTAALTVKCKSGEYNTGFMTFTNDGNKSSLTYSTNLANTNKKTYCSEYTEGVYRVLYYNREQFGEIYGVLNK